MNRHLPMRLILSVVAIVGILMLLTQASSFAQVADPQSQAATPAKLRIFPAFWWSFPTDRCC